MNAQGFVEQGGIKAVAEWADRNPNMDNQDWPATHYKVRLTHTGRQMTVFYSKGIALDGEPTAAEVLYTLALDASGIEDAYSFEDWAAEYGYDTDSRKAERTYKIIGRQAASLRRFLGDALYEELLWKVEKD